MTKRKPKRTSAQKFATLVHAISEEKDFTYESLAEVTGLSYDTVIKYVTALRLHRPKLVYISALEKDALGRRNVRVYSRGSLPDVRIESKTPSERWAERRERYRIKALNQSILGVS